MPFQVLSNFLHYTESGLGGGTATGDYYLNSNPSGYITGFNSGQYLTGFNSGQYMTGFNSGQYATNIDLQSTGSNLFAFINSLSNGVSLIKVTGNNGQSGIINFSGLGGISVQSGTNNYIYFSGVNLVTGGPYYPTYNPSGYITGFNSGAYATIINLQNTGNLLYGYIVSLSGAENTKIDILSGLITDINNNPNNYATSGDIQTLALFFQNLIGVVSGNLENTGISLTTSINSVAANLQTTGSTLYSLIASSSAGVSSIKVTGGYNLSGAINISGAGQISVITGINNFIYVSGVNLTTGGPYYSANNLSGYITGFDSGQYATSANLQSTGSILYNNISGLSGYVYQNYVDILGTGTVSILTGTNFLLVSGDNNDAINLSGNLQSTGSNLRNSFVSLSGNLITTGQTLNNKINLLSGFINNSSISNLVYTTGDQIITGKKMFNGGVTISGQNFQLYDTSSHTNLITYSDGLLFYMAGFEGFQSINVSSRGLYNQNGILALNWYTMPYLLKGNWEADALKISGVDIGNLDNRLYLTGSNLYSLIASSSAGVSAVKVTGGYNLSGVINISGAGQISVITGDNNFIYVSGTNLTTGGPYYPLNNPNGYITGFDSGQYATITFAQNISGDLSSRLYNTGNNLLTLINAASAGVSSINGKSGVISLTGSGNVSVIVNGQTIIISGNTGQYSNFATVANLQSTGQNILTKLAVTTGYLNTNPSGFIRNTQTGQFYPASNPSGYMTGLNGDTLIHNTGLDYYLFSGNVFADQKMTFGQEYLAAFHQRIMSGSGVNVLCVGDSTTQGTNISTNFIHTMINNSLNSYFGIGTAYNSGIGGSNTKQWLTGYLSGQLDANPNLMIIRYGINDGLANRDDFVQDLRSGLQYIRDRRSLDSLSVVLMTPNSTHDPTHGRDREWYEFINKDIRTAARDYYCGFIDTYSLLKDSFSATGWMDTLYGDGSHVHPGDVMNLWIGSKINDFIFPSQLVIQYGKDFQAYKNKVYSPPFSVVSPNVSFIPSYYQTGISMYRATPANGWPQDGQVTTFGQNGGVWLQLNNPYATGTTALSFRVGQSSAFSNWVTITSPSLVKNPTFFPTISTPSSGFETGISLHRVLASDGWPQDGQLITFRQNGGVWLQLNNPYASGESIFSFRVGTSAGLTNWCTISNKNLVKVERFSAIAPLNSDLPISYNTGISIYRATTANGWPIDGMVATIYQSDGVALQFNSNYSNNNQLAFRAGLSTVGWNNSWKYLVSSGDNIIADKITGMHITGNNITGYNINALNTLTISGKPVMTGSANQFYLNSNPAGYATSGNLQNTGISLINLISQVSGALSSCNVFSEIYLYNTGTSKFNKIQMVGTEDSLGLEISSGVDTVQCGSGFVTLNTGSFYLNSNPSGFITSGNYYRPTQLYSGFNPINIDWSSGNAFKYILTGNVQFSFTNNRDGQTIVVGVSNTGTKNYSGIWPTSVHWPSNSVPSQSSGSKMDIYTFVQLHTGIYGNAVQNFNN